MKFIVKLLVIFSALSGLTCASVISDAAAALKPGEWRKLYTINAATVLAEPKYTATDAASGGILGYADGGVWDPNSSQFFFIGSDHFHGTGYAKFVAYDEATNTWREMPRPSWFGPLTGTAMHGYDHNTINAAAGLFYHRPWANATVNCYNISAGTWSTLPSNSNFSTGAFGLAHFPEAGGLVAGEAGGGAYFFNETTRQWTTLAPNGGGLHTVAEYNPVHKLVIFGGGNGNRALYKMDANRTITRMKDAPCNFGSDGASGLLTVDPVSGDFLIFTADGRFYVYDVVSDTWTLKPGSNFFDPNIQDLTFHIWEVVAAPYAKYGVVTFVKANYSSSTLYLYKHASPSAIDGPDKIPPAAEGLNVTISPNPFSSSASISIVSNGHERISAGIYNVQGQRVADLSPYFSRSSRMTWDAGQAPAGIYLLKCVAGNEAFSRTLFLRK